jgi:hypothetical protein
MVRKVTRLQGYKVEPETTEPAFEKAPSTYIPQLRRGEMLGRCWYGGS